MERILLVEPNYKNKYPPIGLMKIASYFRNKGDIVELYKGEAPYMKIVEADKILITSLFTFHYEITIKCIRHYQKYASNDKIFIGGIAATLLAEKFSSDTGIANILTGQLTSSNKLGYSDEVNIDTLPLDYDILDDISYKYPAGDNYFIYTTRGCPRGCSFCAVSILEPKFETTNNVINQVRLVDNAYGEKRNLLVMDNNILCSRSLEHIVDDIESLGFTHKPSYMPPNPMKQMLEKIARRKRFEVPFSNQVNQATTMIDEFASRMKRYEKASAQYCALAERIATSENPYQSILENEEELLYFFDKYRSKLLLQRYVDFNQGIDARLINDDNAKTLARLPIRPFRLAYDTIEETDSFTKATKIAAKQGIRHFSNYMLYNWEDKPEDLWTRLDNAIELYNNCGSEIKAFSFPMRFAPITEIDRSYIGEHWNKKYLSAINLIINVTKGVVTQGRDFFHEAFGSNHQEYFEILSMPDDFIRFRHYFVDNGLIDAWRLQFRGLSSCEQRELIRILSESKTDRSILYNSEHTLALKKILIFYIINKAQFDRNEMTAETLIQQSNTMR